MINKPAIDNKLIELDFNDVEMLFMSLNCCLMILQCFVYDSEKLFNDFEKLFNDLSSGSKNFGSAKTTKGVGCYSVMIIFMIILLNVIWLNTCTGLRYKRHILHAPKYDE